MDPNQHQPRRRKRVSRTPDLRTISELCIEFHSMPNIAMQPGDILLPSTANENGLPRKLERLGHTHLLRVATAPKTDHSLVTGSIEIRKLERLGQTCLPRFATTPETSQASHVNGSNENRKLERMGRTHFSRVAVISAIATY